MPDTVRKQHAKPVKPQLPREILTDSVSGIDNEMNLVQGLGTTYRDSTVWLGKEETSGPIDLFKGHELEAKHEGPQPLNRHPPDWIFPVLLLVFAAFAWLRTFYYKYFVQILSAFWNTNLASQIVRDENILLQRASVILNILFYLVAALFLYFISIRYAWSLGGIGTGINRYLFFTLIITAAYAVKFLVLKICGYLFHISKEMSTYMFNIFLINNVLCMLLIPLVSLLAFGHFASTSVIMTFSIALVVVAYIYRVIRGLVIGYTSTSFSPYYLFLYLCTLEFAPLLVLVKILSQK